MAFTLTGWPAASDEGEVWTYGEYTDEFEGTVSAIAMSPDACRGVRDCEPGHTRMAVRCVDGQLGAMIAYGHLSRPHRETESGINVKFGDKEPTKWPVSPSEDGNGLFVDSPEVFGAVVANFRQVMTRFDYANRPKVTVTYPLTGAAKSIAKVFKACGMGELIDVEYLLMEPIGATQLNYPREALVQGLEGSVILEFTVAETGNVGNPVFVIEAKPPGVGFEQAAIQAVLTRKYKPKIVDGEPVAVVGVQAHFVFELEDDTP